MLSVVAGARLVKVMADHGASPLWAEAGPSVLGSTELDSLPLSQGLRDRPRARSIEYDRHALQRRWSELMTDWNDRGRRLAQQVAAELGAGWRVVYGNEITGVAEAI